MKFSIVTPSFNSERFIAETIKSVISQEGNFEIEYFIMDNCSTDNSRNIIEEYIRKIEKEKDTIRCNGINIIYKSEHDKGMYDAINKGFSYATGDIYAYINADDVYLAGTFDKITRVFRKYKEMRWLKGITSYMDETSKIWRKGRCLLYNQKWIQQGIYGREAYFIQQDSVFWRSDLWKKSGGFDEGIKLAGDYSLWIKFAGLTPLYTLNEEVSCFRKVHGQKSQDMTSYYNEYEKVNIPLKDEELCRKVVHYFSREAKISSRFMKIMLYVRLFGMPRYQLINLVNLEPQMKVIYYHIAN